jgi:RND family efflux transporter MFP subunit
VAQLSAEVARLEKDLARTAVRAPFGGVVVNELVAEGEWLDAGGAVAELVDFQDLEVTVEVPESSYAGVVEGVPARVVIGALDGLEVEGRVRAVVPRADARARTFPVKVAITYPTGKIGVGLLAQVFLPVGETQATVLVPKDAVVQRGGQSIIFRIGEGSVLESLNVELGASAGAWIGVYGEVRQGDHIVTRGNERVFPGQTVEAKALEYELP